MKVIYLLLLTLSFIACSDKNQTIGSDFFEKKLQSVEARSIIKNLANIDNQSIDSLSLFKTSMLKQGEKYLYLNDNSSKKKRIAFIDKNNLKLVKSAQLTEGKGPGEVLAINAFDVSSKHIALLDSRTSRIVILDRQGNFVKELIIEKIVPSYLALLNDNSILVYSSTTDNYMFREYNLNGTLQNEFAKQQKGENYNSMKYTGHLQVQNGDIYFLGYGESILKKFEQNGNLLFSRSSIDNWSTEDNYERYNTGEFKVQRFTEDAKYAFTDFTVWADYLIAIPHHNMNAEYRYLDIYDTKKGDYLGTLKTEGFALEVVTDDQFIYTKEDLNGDISLKKYPNVIPQLLK